MVASAWTEIRDESPLAPHLDRRARRQPRLAQNKSSTSGSSSTQSAAKQKYIKDTLAVGSLSLILSRMALPKLNTAQLKQFAEFEIAEQETVADVLTALKTNAAPTGAIPTPSDAEAMQNLNETGKATVEKFRKLQAGSAFDGTSFKPRLTRTGCFSEFRKPISRARTISTRPTSPSWRKRSSRST